MGMRIFITGICGFVGSSIANWLAGQSALEVSSIIGLDNFSRPGSWQNREPLRELGVNVVHGDLRSKSDLEGIGRVDWVVDAAANPSVLAGLSGAAASRQLMEHNLLGTLNLLEYCKRWQAAMTLLSTSRVYSIEMLSQIPLKIKDNGFSPTSNSGIPGFSQSGISECFSTASPVSLYGSTKLASEQLALEYGHAFEFPVWVNRCGVLAGARQFGKADQGIFSFWLHSYRRRGSLRYIGFGGHGHQVRDCLHPDDVGSLAVKQVQSSGTGFPRIVNVSGGVESAMSLANLSAWCAKRWGEMEIGFEPSSRPYDLPWLVLDSQMAKDCYDWRPAITTKMILEQISQFADERPDWFEVSR